MVEVEACVVGADVSLNMARSGPAWDRVRIRVRVIVRVTGSVTDMVMVS